MPRRVLINSDFPKSLILSILPPPDGRPCSNVLILLHGLGDTHEPFAALGKNLNLPETTCIAIRGPTPLPFDLDGFHWGDDMLFDERSGALDDDAGFTLAARLIASKVIHESLIAKSGFTARDITLFGYGQGGMAALAVAAELAHDELAGVVSIDGALPAIIKGPFETGKSATPILLCGGHSSPALGSEGLARTKERFTYVEVARWNRTDKSMPRTREEMLPIMQFLARRQRSRRGVPDDAFEISS